MTGAALRPAELEQALLAEGVDWAVSVPDWVQLPLYRRLGRPGSACRLLPVCAEDEAVAAAAGLTLAGRRPIVLVQNQGFYAAVNNIRAITLDSELPMVFLVGQFGLEPDRVGDAGASGRRIARLLPRLLDALELPHRPLDVADDLDSVRWAFAERDAGRSAVLVMSRNMRWSDAA